MRPDRFTVGALVALLLITTTLGCAGNEIPVDATPADILGRAEAKLAKRKYLDAAELLEYFLRTYPGTGETPRAKLRLGDARFGLEEYVLARGQYEDVVEDYPASGLVEESRYKIALCSYAAIYPHYLDQTETERAIRLLEDFRRDYPNSVFLNEVEDAITECRQRLARGDYEAGRFYEKQRRLRSAKIQYEFVAMSYPETMWACQARYRLGLIHQKRGNLEEAKSWFRRTADNCPETDEAELARRALEEIRGAEVAKP